MKLQIIHGHKYLNKLGADEIRSQVELCNQAVAAVTGESPRLVRLPGGNKTTRFLGNVNYPMIMWNIDTLDWKTKKCGQDSPGCNRKGEGRGYCSDA